MADDAEDRPDGLAALRQAIGGSGEGDHDQDFDELPGATHWLSIPASDADAEWEALADARAQGLPTINVAPNQAKLLYLLARSIGARRVLEEKRRSPCATAGCGGGG